MTEWIDTGQGAPNLAPDTWIEARGRYGDIYGPLPFAMFNPLAWESEMFHASHDLWAYRIVDRG